MMMSLSSKAIKKGHSTPFERVKGVIQQALLALGLQKLQEVLTKSLPLNLHATHALPSSPKKWNPLISPFPNLPKDQV